MALQPERVEFFLQQMEDSAPNTFRGNTAQLFEHLDTEIKDNPVFAQYESSKAKWLQWLEDIESQSYGTDWEMPTSFEDAKQLAYAVYRKIAGEADNTMFLFTVTGNQNWNCCLLTAGCLMLCCTNSPIKAGRSSTNCWKKVNGRRLRSLSCRPTTFSLPAPTGHGKT